MLIIALLCIVCVAAKKPNVVFIIADDLGWNDVDWHDSELHTPNIYSLAFNHGVILNQSYVNQLCSPTRSALLSGHFPFHLGTQNGVFHACEPIGVPTQYKFFPEFLQDAGYDTHMVGKWHVGYCNRSYIPFGRGFDSFYGYYMGMEDYFTHVVSTNEAYTGYDFWDGARPDFSQKGIYSTEIFAKKAKSVLKSQVKSAKPFFLYLAFQAVHFPLEVPTQYLAPCKQKRKDRRLYCGMLNALDIAVGSVVEALKTYGFYDNTLIIFSTDNGAHTAWGGNNFPLRGNKATLWEGGTRAISFLHSPLFFPPEGQQREQLFHIVDWFPTILSAIGFRQDSYGDGLNQWEMITQNRPGKRKLIVYKIYQKEGSAIRYGRYKLILGNPGQPSGWIRPTETPPPHPRPITGTFLFDLENDPTEHVNLVKKRPEVVKKMLRILRRLWKEEVPDLHVPVDPRGDPANFNGTFATGWCT